MSQHIHYRHWEDRDEADLANASDFKQLAGIALRVIRRKPPLIHMVSGPISTGGIGNGNIEINMRAFRATVEHLHSKGLNVFSQIPFEGKLRQLLTAWQEQHAPEDYCMPILEEFYLRIFETGKIAVLHFMFDYESSFGATWEHGTCERLRIERRYLEKGEGIGDLGLLIQSVPD